MTRPQCSKVYRVNRYWLKRNDYSNTLAFYGVIYLDHSLFIGLCKCYYPDACVLSWGLEITGRVNHRYPEPLYQQNGSKSHQSLSIPRLPDHLRPSVKAGATGSPTGTAYKVSHVSWSKGIENNSKEKTGRWSLLNRLCFHQFFTILSVRLSSVHDTYFADRHNEYSTCPRR